MVSPFAGTDIPSEPAELPATWALLAFARRELDKAFVRPSTTAASPADPTAGQSVDPTGAAELLASVAEAAVATPIEQLTPAEYDASAGFTGQPSIVSQVFVAALRIINPILRAIGIDLTATTGTIPFLSDGIPPFFLTGGLDVKSDEYDGWKVWTLTPSQATGERVIAIHGGAFISQVNIFQWSTYADMARDTGATLVVPLYPLANPAGTGGTAATVVPTAADFIADQVTQYGAENVSVLGDSAGGTIALTATQELVRRCNGDPVCRTAQLPGRLVLIAPVLDLTMSNPNIALVDDPLLSAEGGKETRKIWAAGLGTPEDPDGTKNPLASPIYGSLEGLPPTTVYAGSLDLLTPDVLVLQQKVASIPGADFTFELRNGQIHDWIIFPFLPDAITERPGLYRHLGITGDDLTRAT